jgi:ribonuclease BN (tRNA processing enzyme)
VWIDCGSGTFAALKEHIDPTDLDAIWLSHLHPDHCADLLTAFNWAVNTNDVGPLAVHGPPGWAARLASMLPVDDAERIVRQTFDVHELLDGTTSAIGDLQMTSPDSAYVCKAEESRWPTPTTPDPVPLSSILRAMSIYLSVKPERPSRAPATAPRRTWRRQQPRRAHDDSS